MHSGFEIPGLHQHHQQPPENSCPPLLLSMNPTHILDQIHALPTTQNLALDHHHFLPPHHQTRLSHHYAAAASSSAAYFPLNFKLGLNEFKNGGGDSLLRGSEQFHLSDARQSSLGMLHAPFWEPLPAEVSNENSEIVDRHELNQKETLTNCLDAKSKVHFGELEAIYKRLGNNAEELEPSLLNPSKKKKKAKKKKRRLVSPMAEFFEDLVKQVMDHQDNLQKKFTEVMDRLNEERRAREEEWRNQELAHFQREAAVTAHEKAMAKSREDLIVSYLEKITGRRINLPPLETSPDNSNCRGNDEIERDAAQNGPPTYY